MQKLLGVAFRLNPLTISFANLNLSPISLPLTNAAWLVKSKSDTTLDNLSASNFTWILYIVLTHEMGWKSDIFFVLDTLGMRVTKVWLISHSILLPSIKYTNPPIMSFFITFYKIWKICIVNPSGPQSLIYTQFVLHPFDLLLWWNSTHPDIHTWWHQLRKPWFIIVYLAIVYRG